MNSKKISTKFNKNKTKTSIIITKMWSKDIKTWKVTFKNSTKKSNLMKVPIKIKCKVLKKFFLKSYKQKNKDVSNFRTKWSKKLH